MNQTREIIDRRGTQRTYTDEGFLVVPARIARTGIQEYRAFELGIADGDPMRTVRIYRAPEEVFKPEAIASFENKPATDNHPTEFVTAANWKDLAVGFARNVRRDGDYLVADLIITSRDAIDKIAGGKVELSNGYYADYDWTPGTTPDGQAYDAQQKNIRGNHVALVDAARCGPACRVSDQKPTGANTMAVKVTIDGIPFELDEAAAAAVTKLINDRDALRQARDSAPKPSPVKLGEVTVHVSDAEPVLKLIADHQKEIEQLKKDVITPDQRDALVETWAGLVADAKRLVPNFDSKGKTCDAIRRGVLAELQKDAGRKVIIDAALAGAKIEDAHADTVKIAFNVVAAAAPTKATPAGSDPVADALRGSAHHDGQPQPSARDGYIARMNDGLK